ncbi:hypothetical protein [Tissierella creatinophila]|uniref:Uncharacterized protein n=1 Tax=Tissierella creatinophila DSM 6911 TaxID=1123403 RepID=A0A1U7M3T6_TISCR|nr:hypothetical protein [Tissierella creatinophila]OLS01858.1 hypothetical protein TICRE_22350 [Tissierella creatinophila DSM 6911]
MKINFTKKQFRILLDLLFAGEYVINGHRVPDEIIKEYEDIKQYVYSFAKQFGYEDLIEFDKEFNMFFETRKHDESKINELISEYDNEVFWDELSSNLAKRDISKEYIGEKKDINHEELMRKIWSREEEYNEEFYENGLDNVTVDL